MRIAYLTADFGVPVDGTKGASIHVRALVRALLAEGHEVIVLASSAGEGSTELIGCNVRALPFAEELRELVDALRQEPVCKGTRLGQDVRNLLYAASLAHQARPVLDDFRPDVLYERYSLFGTGGDALARELGVPLLVEVNAPLVLEQQKMRGLSLPAAAQLAERRVFTAADHLFVVSEWLRGYVTARGADPDRVTVLPNAADPDQFHPREPSQVRRALGWDREFVIGFVGSMKPWHGVDILLEALDLLGGASRRFRLLLVGSGPMVAQLEAEIGRRGLEQAVHLTGAVPHRTVPELVAAMDVAVAPYAPDADGYFSPVKLFEYLAVARPVVAARLGQVEEILEHGRTGWLYTPGDAQELARIIRALAADGSLRQRVGAAARDQVLARHTWQCNARQVESVAHRILVSRSPRAGTPGGERALPAGRAAPTPGELPGAGGLHARLSQPASVHAGVSRDRPPQSQVGLGRLTDGG